MSKNNPTKLEKKPNTKSKLFSESLFIGLTAVGILFLVSLLTYSKTENPFSGGVLVEPVMNQAGVFGAYLSDILMSLLGYSSFWFAFMFFWFGFKVHQLGLDEYPNKSIIVVKTISFLLLVFFTAALFTVLLPNNLPSGGQIGESTHGGFVLIFGSMSSVIYVALIMITYSVTFTASWVNYFKNLFSFSSGVIDKQKTKSLEKKKQKLEINTPIGSNIEEKKPSKIAQMTKKKKPKAATSANLFTASKSSDLPSLDFLINPPDTNFGYSKEALEEMSRQVELKLKDFGFDVEITAVTPGPVVTQFELALAPGVKVSQILNLNKDLARALLVESVRIVDVIPGKPVIGLEIPNEYRETIYLKEVLSSETFNNSKSLLTVGLGKNINGEPVVANLAKMPHLLVAGATGMGKSVGLNAMILSVLYKARPDEVRIIMIDPKIVELAIYADIPHLLTPVITDMNEAASALWWSVNEMERRYSLLAKFGVRNIDGFNEKIIKARKAGKPILDPFFNEKDSDEPAPELETLPLIMVVIDEYADMLGALSQEDRGKAKRVESLIVRLAQKARAAGIHLIIATQRPSVDVITGLIKSNVPSRVAFKVSSKVDSRTILDQGGAEQLLGMGDMLYMSPGISHLVRVHGAFVDDGEIKKVVDFLKENSETSYLNEVLHAEIESGSESGTSGSGELSGELDELYDQAVQIVTSTGRASISSLQRRMRIGYNRAARIIEDMEIAGVVSPMDKSGGRTVLAPKPIEED